MSASRQDYKKMLKEKLINASTACYILSCVITQVKTGKFDGKDEEIVKETIKENYGKYMKCDKRFLEKVNNTDNQKIYNSFNSFNTNILRAAHWIKHAPILVLSSWSPQKNSIKAIFACAQRRDAHCIEKPALSSNSKAEIKDDNDAHCNEMLALSFNSKAEIEESIIADNKLLILIATLYEGKCCICKGHKNSFDKKTICICGECIFCDQCIRLKKNICQNNASECLSKTAVFITQNHI